MPKLTVGEQHSAEQLWKKKSYKVICAKLKQNISRASWLLSIYRTVIYGARLQFYAIK